MNEWRTIDDNAPKDGRRILLWGPEWWHPEPGSWDTQPYHKRPKPHWSAFKHAQLQGAAWMKANQPTLWMPLAEPPAAPAAGHKESGDE